jgi:hypothetical protein
MVVFFYKRGLLGFTLVAWLDAIEWLDTLVTNEGDGREPALGINSFFFF